MSSSSVPNWRQHLKALVWKNSFLLRKRHWLLTILEVLIPLLLASSLALIRSSSKLSKTSAKVVHVGYPFGEELYTETVQFLGCHYVPGNQFTKKLMEMSKMRNTRAHASEYEMLKYFRATYRNMSDTRLMEIPFVGIIFNEQAANSNATAVPKTLSYKIRISDTFDTGHEFKDRSARSGVADPYTEWFVGLQLLINKAYTELASGEVEKSPPQPLRELFFLQAMPSAIRNVDTFLEHLKFTAPFISTLSFIIMCVTASSRIVSEKQSGAMELMKMMGMKKWTYWLSWMMDSLILNSLTAALMVVLLVFPFNSISGPVLDKTNPLLLLCLFILYCIAGIASLFAISTFFTKPIFALIASFFFWILAFLMSIYSNFRNPQLTTKILTMIFPNMGLFHALTVIFDNERQGLHTQWSNIHISATDAPDDLSLLAVMLMLLFDAAFYSLITWYTSEVNPGEYGHKKPLLFFLSKTYWSSSRETASQLEDIEEQACQLNFEHPLLSKLNKEHASIVIRNLTKTYPGQPGYPKVDAIKGMSLDIRRGEITVLLGHNGAGKSTLMSILTGLIAPTSGSVLVDGLDLSSNLPKIRQSIGLCPGHNLLFDELTVFEHLVFFALLKGLSSNLACLESKQLLTTVRLLEKKDAYVSELSGGMKRKLSLAIALVGDSKIVMLDEPTSGLDPQIRREIWDLLLVIRKNKTIILSTHHMEEADALGDTVAIMTGGHVICCGSTIYLKKLYGVGYHLNIILKHACDVKEVTSAVKKALPEADVVTSFESFNAVGPGSVEYILPANKRSQFPALLNMLETTKSELGVASFGVSVTTLEEVFLRVDELLTENNESQQIGQKKPSPNCELIALEKNCGWKQSSEQFGALLVKKCIVVKRQWATLALQLTVPALMMLCAILMCYLLVPQSKLAEVELSVSLKLYGSNKNLEVLYAYDNSEIMLANSFEHIVLHVARPRKVTGNIYEEWMTVQRNTPSKFHSNYIVAARFNKSGAVVAMYRREAIHSIPIAIDLVSNAVLKLRASPDYQIFTQNHPLPNLKSSRAIIMKYDSYFIFSCTKEIPGIWMAIAHLGWIFSISLALVLPLQERVQGCRHLQLMAGCPLPLIWLSYLLIDVLTIIAMSLLVLAVISPFDYLRIYTSWQESGTLLLIFFLYGVSGTAFSYFTSLVKNSVSSAFGFVVYTGLFAGCISNLLVYLRELTTSDGKRDETAELLRAALGLLLPHFAFVSSLLRFSGTAAYNSVCRIIPSEILADICSSDESSFTILRACCENCKEREFCFKPLDYLRARGTSSKFHGWLIDYGSIREELIYLAISAVAWSCIVILLDSGLLSGLLERMTSKFEKKVEIDYDVQDEDVLQEMLKAEAFCIVNGVEFPWPLMNPQKNDDMCSLAVSSLSKRFGLSSILKPRFTAVQNLGFCINKGECFGLLGVNGAGKSTTFQMLAGLLPFTNGNAILSGCQLRKSRLQFLRNLGYCPQTEPHLGILTGREILQLYSRLRGVKPTCIQSEVDKWLDNFGLTGYADQTSSMYSGGNKRKLSVALALIGGPHPLVLLDEPTSGMDPVSRRQVWKALNLCQRSGQSILLASHSMDECEILCSRLGIMVDGRLACVGPINHLKEKFCQGFALKVKICSSLVSHADFPVSNLDQKLLLLKEDMRLKFAPCRLQDENETLLHYRIMKVGLKWSDLFLNLELLKRNHTIVEDYTVSETTLEQVFLSFA